VDVVRDVVLLVVDLVLVVLLLVVDVVFVVALWLVDLLTVLLLPRGGTAAADAGLGSWSIDESDESDEKEP